MLHLASLPLQWLCLQPFSFILSYASCKQRPQEEDPHVSPKSYFSVESSKKFSNCDVCLLEFVVGDEIRVLSLCGQGFHVARINTWLGSHSSYPYCRQILVVAKCTSVGVCPPLRLQLLELELRLKPD
ncbi:hypothetical protein REPUB_Repub18cG0132300 [Reevesia pubescens]